MLILICEIVDSELARVRTERTGVISLTADDAEKERKFTLARKSVRIWPVAIECRKLPFSNSGTNRRRT